MQIAGPNYILILLVKNTNQPGQTLLTCSRWIIVLHHVYLLILSWTRSCKFIAHSAKVQLASLRTICILGAHSLCHQKFT
uniref:Uncharacterized protein n=1 Tax=Rhizophora mucronata TaxID=61149 RepID=A0A2P2IJK5_RHIMU